MTTAVDDDNGIRRAIREAMDRLIDGKPLYSDGKLTVKALAEEARIKRWLLTHRHTDLQDEFRARIANTDSRTSGDTRITGRKDEGRQTRESADR